MADSVYNLPVQLVVDVYCLTLHDLFDPTLSGKALVPVRVAFNHFNQLMRSYEVVQDDHVFGDHRNLFFRIVHLGHD